MDQDRVQIDALFAQAAAGDPVSLDALLERYLPQMHAFVRARLLHGLRPRESSLDVVQSVCRQLLGKRDAFAFQGEERFRAWLFTSVLNKMREKARRQGAEMRDVGREVADDAVPAIALASLLTPSRVAIGKETAAAVSAALVALSDEHREVITLARLARLPHRIIAETMGRSEEAVRQLLGRALTRLARELRLRGVDIDRPPAPA